MHLAEGSSYTRRDIVLGVAEQEGGAHVATEPTNEYRKLLTPGLMWAWWRLITAWRRSRPPWTCVRFKYIRQMAYELLSSLELLKLAGYSPTRPAKHEEQPADAEGEEQSPDGQSDEEAQDKPEITDRHGEK